jgi:Rhs element Vgr protein
MVSTNNGFIMDAALSKIHIQATVNGELFSVKSLTGSESISSPFVYEFTLQGLVLSDLSSAIGTKANLLLKADDGFTRHISGLVIQVEEQGVNTNGYYQAKVVIASQLIALKHVYDSKVYLDKSLFEICEKLLQSVNIHPSQIQWLVSESRNEIPMHLQLNEDHFSFFHRLLAENGLFYWSQCIDGREVIVISDSNLKCPYIERDAIVLKNQAGLSPSWFYGCFKKQVKYQRQLTKSSVQFHSEPPKPATTHPTANHHLYELGHTDPSLVKQAACWAQQSIECQKSRIEMTTNVEQMSAGFCFSFVDQPTMKDHSGDYLVIAADHHYDEADSGQTGYRCNVIAIRREVPYRAPMPKRPQLPFALSAKIESNNAYAHIDEQGRYAARLEFDLSGRTHTQATQPLRKLAPYACAGQDQSTGLHFPLLDGDRILISCLNNNPQQAYIVGFVQQDDQLPVVTAENIWQNRIRTAAGNELIMDDHNEMPRIVLQSLNSEHKLELNATQGAPFVELLCQFGALSVVSGSHQYLTSGDTLTEQIAGSRNIKVSQNHLTKTTGDVRRQSAGTARLQSQDAIHLQSEENTRIKLGKGVQVRSEQSHILKAQGDALQITASKGSLFLQANDNITIEGDGRGDIIIENGGGGIKMDAEGNVTLFGQVISFNQDKVIFNGNVSYDIESPPSPPTVEVETPDELDDVDEFELINSKAEPKEREICIDIIDAFENELPNHRAIYDGLPWRLIGDTGEIESGTIKDGKITATLTYLKSYDIEIDGLPDIIIS